MKRKRGGESEEEKLVHGGTRSVARAVKKAKAFEIAKAVRRCKECRTRVTGSTDDAAAACEKTAKKAAASLAAIKEVDAEACVKLSLRKAGVAYIGAAGAGLSELEGSAAARRILSHNAVAEALSALDERATDIRRKKLLRSDPSFRAAELERRKLEDALAKKKKKQSKAGLSLSTSTAFVESLDGTAREMEVIEEEEEEEEDGNKQSLRNRMGQRQRRALADADDEHRKKIGKPPKVRTRERAPPTVRGSSHTAAAAAAFAAKKKTQSKPKEPEGPLHASWAAKKAREAPVEFKGKKVTFD